MIDETQTASRVLISSFDHRDVAAANVPGREYALGILVMTPLYQAERYVRDIVGADTIHFSADVVGSETVAYRRGRSPESSRARACGGASIDAAYPTLVYTVNDYGPGSLAEHLAAIGVAGLFTDDPSGMSRSGFSLTS